MKNIYVILIIFSNLLFSCSSTEMNKLALALDSAGDNREELLKVLQYYKNDPDTLKYKAAVYLIQNMPYHCSTYNKDVGKIEKAKKEYIKNGFVKGETIKKLKENCMRLESIADLKCMKADFLIRNIEQAFEAWRKRPRGKHYTFEGFCEYLLPYRALDEPLEEWRTLYSKRYAYILDSIYTGTDVAKAANAICSVLKEEKFIHTMTFNSMGNSAPSFLMDNRIGDCSDECNFTTYVLRSLGIPTQYDYYPFSPETFSSHGWCVMLDTTKLNVPLFFTDFFAERGNMQTDPRKKCKVYRRTYKLQDQVVAVQLDKTIPNILKNPFHMDVSPEYFNTELSLAITDETKKYYLGVFNREKIIPIVAGEVKKNKVFFGTVEDKNIYLLLSGTADNLKLESEPFVFQGNSVHYLKADLSKMNDELLYRKYPLPVWNRERMYRIIHAKFYGGTQRNKINRQLYEICDTPYVSYNRYPLGGKDEKYRYIKYVARDSILLELAELHFFNGNSEIKPVNIIAGECYDERNEEMRCQNCFDNNPLTYFLSKNRGDSIIFDFGRDIAVTQAVCVPRNDDNFIRIGDEYELFYFDKEQGWIALLREVADDTFIECKVPSNALLLLKDRVRGEEEQIFIFRNHRQIYINNL